MILKGKFRRNSNFLLNTLYANLCYAFFLIINTLLLRKQRRIHLTESRFAEQSVSFVWQQHAVCDRTVPSFLMNTCVSVEQSRCCRSGELRKNERWIRCRCYLRFSDPLWFVKTRYHLSGVAIGTSQQTIAHSWLASLLVLIQLAANIISHQKAWKITQQKCVSWFHFFEKFQNSKFLFHEFF